MIYLAPLIGSGAIVFAKGQRTRSIQDVASQPNLSELCQYPGSYKAWRLEHSHCARPLTACIDASLPVSFKSATRRGARAHYIHSYQLRLVMLRLVPTADAIA